MNVAGVPVRPVPCAVAVSVWAPAAAPSAPVREPELWQLHRTYIVAPVRGGLESRRSGRPATAVAMLQAFVPNQGDGWAYFAGVFGEYVTAGVGRPVTGEEWALPDVGWTALAAATPPERVTEHLGAALDAARVLGRRTAEFHHALATELALPFAVGAALLTFIADVVRARTPVGA